MMNNDDFLQAIAEKPSEDANLLVYADWLEDQGDEESVIKADFLRRLVEYAVEEKRLGKTSTLRHIVSKLRNTVRASLGSKPRSASSPLTKVEQHQLNRQILEELAPHLDKNWLAVVSRLPVRNCVFGKRNRRSQSNPSVTFQIQCPRNWEDLESTELDHQRFCQGCQKHVYFCPSVDDAVRHARQGHCVAINFNVDEDVIESRIRNRPEVPQMLMGLIRHDGPPPVRRRRRR